MSRGISEAWPPKNANGRVIAACDLNPTPGLSQEFNDASEAIETSLLFLLGSSGAFDERTLMSEDAIQ